MDTLIRSATEILMNFLHIKLPRSGGNVNSRVAIEILTSIEEVLEHISKTSSVLVKIGVINLCWLYFRRNLFVLVATYVNYVRSFQSTSKVVTDFLLVIYCNRKKSENNKVDTLMEKNDYGLLWFHQIVCLNRVVILCMIYNVYNMCATGLVF